MNNVRNSQPEMREAFQPLDAIVKLVFSDSH